MPTNSLAAWFETGLPSISTFKDNVGPYDVAMVGEEGTGVGDDNGESEAF